MAKEFTYVPDFDDIVFKNRNQIYGAYRLRKRYTRTLLISIVVGTLIVVAIFMVQYYRAKTLQLVEQREAVEVIAEMENLDQPEDLNVEAPPPPPPPEEAQQQLRYVAPEVVEEVDPEDQVDLLVADEAVEIIRDEEVTEDVVEVVEIQEEAVEEYAPPEEALVIVEEMPMFPGGEEALYEYIYSTIEYPPIALENDITGMVIVRFVVTWEGKVSNVEILRGIDESLDNEAKRVVESLPTFRPGRQAGQPVNVWYIVRINFQIQRN